jgi:hypothetical protein
MAEDGRWLQRVSQTVKRAWKLLAIVLIIVILSVAGLYLTRGSSYTCSYTLLAQSDSDEVFMLYVPVPSSYSGATFADIAEQAVFRGALAREIVDGTYGTALKVSGTGRLEVDWSSRSVSALDWGYFSRITMHNDSLNFTTGMTSTWMFSDDPNVSVYLKFSAASERWPSPWFKSGSSNSYELLMASGATGWRPVPTEHEGVLFN